MIVIDASVLVGLFLPGPATAAIDRRVFLPGETLHAPHLVDIEVSQSIRRLVIAGKIGVGLGGKAMRDLVAITMQRYSHGVLLPRIWELRNNLTAYDASYVALAELLGAPLLTLDRRLAAAPGHLARIEVF